MKLPDRDAQGHFLPIDYLAFGFERKVEGIFWDVCFIGFLLVMLTELIG